MQKLRKICYNQVIRPLAKGEIEGFRNNKQLGE